MSSNKFATAESTYDVEDLAVGFVRYDSGLSLELEFSWASNIGQEYNFIELYGTKGGLKYERGQLTLFEDFQGNVIDATPKLKGDGAWGNTETRHFVDVILNGGEVLSKPEEAVKIMQIIQGVYASAESGGEVRVG
jgi:predicted dehydrogenase